MVISMGSVWNIQPWNPVTAVTQLWCPGRGETDVYQHVFPGSFFPNSKQWYLNTRHRYRHKHEHTVLVWIWAIDIFYIIMCGVCDDTVVVIQKPHGCRNVLHHPHQSLVWGLWNIWYLSKAHLKLKSREISFVQIIRISCPIVLKIDTAVLCANFLKRMGKYGNKLWQTRFHEMWI